MDLQDINLKAYDPQIRFLNLNARYIAFIAGLGSGKTYALCMWALKKAINQRGFRGLMASRTYPMLRDVVIPTFFEVTPAFLIEDFNRRDNKIKIINGSEILFRPLESKKTIERIRGLNLNWAGLDEAAYVPEKAWDVLQGRLRQGESHQMAVSTTPKGFNWVYNRFIEKDSDKYRTITGVKTSDNPFLSQEYIDDLREEYTGEYLRQEFYGEFVRFEGLVYTEFRRSENVLTEEEINRTDISRYIYGYDSGFRQPRVFLKIGITTDDNFIVTDEFYQKQCMLSDGIDRFMQMYEGGMVYADPSAAEDIEEMRRRGIDVQGGDNAVDGGIQQMKKLFDKDILYVSESCQATLNELNTYRWDDNKDKPVKESDHAMDAMRYAVYSAEKGYSGQIFKKSSGV